MAGRSSIVGVTKPDIYHLWSNLRTRQKNCEGSGGGAKLGVAVQPAWHSYVGSAFAAGYIPVAHATPMERARGGRGMNRGLGSVRPVPSKAAEVDLFLGVNLARRIAAAKMGDGW